MVTGARWGKGAKVTYTKKYSVKPEAQLMMHHFLYAKRGVKVRFWCENFPSAPLRGGGCSAPSAHAYMTPPRSEKNGFEPGFEPPFWDILADLGGRPALKRSLLADRNNPTVEWEAGVF